MTRMIPREKMSKKDRKRLDRQKRGTWQISPVTRSVPSKKLYNRHRKSCDYQDDWNRGIICLVGVNAHEHHLFPGSVIQQELVMPVEQISDLFHRRCQPCSYNEGEEALDCACVPLTRVA